MQLPYPCNCFATSLPSRYLATISLPRYLLATSLPCYLLIAGLPKPVNIKGDLISFEQIKSLQWPQSNQQRKTLVVFLALEEQDRLNIWGPFHKYDRGIMSPDHNALNSSSKTKLLIHRQSKGTITILSHDCVHGGMRSPGPATFLLPITPLPFRYQITL